MTQSKSWIKNSKLFYMYAALLLQVVWTPEVDLNGYPMISNPYCRDISIQRCECTQGTKMTQSKSRIKNSKLFYMYAALSPAGGTDPPEVDLNGYPRISNPYYCDIQIQRCEWTQGKKMTQSKSWIKNSKLFYMCAALLLQVVWTPRS